MDKFDIEAVNNWTDQYILENKTEVLFWTQDINWPVSGAIFDRIINLFSDFEEEILKILRGGDIEWKMSIICGILWAIEDIPHEIILELERIRDDPKEHLDVRDVTEEIFKR